MEKSKTIMEEMHGYLDRLDAMGKDMDNKIDMLENLLIDQGILLPEKRQKGPNLRLVSSQPLSKIRGGSWQ